MAYDEGLAQRIRDVMRERPGSGEKRMFGGVCFTWHAHMVVGVVKDTLMARVGEQYQATALRRSGVRPMDFTGKPLKGYVHVDASAIAEDRDLAEWVALALAFVETLPPKTSKPQQGSVRLRKPATRLEAVTRKIVVENVNVPGYTQTVDAAKYLEMRRAMLKMLPAKPPGMTQTEIRTAVVDHLSADLFPGGAKADWWSKLVQLDLEAKGLIVREQAKPLRWCKARR
jgi:TfoX/Sxy family transcriptional regulator of competence genes